MKIIAHLTFKAGARLEEFLAVRAEEAAVVWSLYKSGAIRDAALRRDLKGAVLTFEAASEDEVRALLATLPAVNAGIFGYELIAVGPFLSWETLFTGDKP